MSGGSECDHPAYFADMCVVCGCERPDDDFDTKNGPSSTSSKRPRLVKLGHLAPFHTDGSRDDITRDRNASTGDHDRPKLLVASEFHVNKVSSLHFADLVQNRKLVLVLDIDHTLVHTIEACHTDEYSLNRSIVRHIDNGKFITVLRPGIQDLLFSFRDKYEIHLCTMGMRSYAYDIANLIDPGRKFITNIVTRHDYEDSKQKSLRSLMVYPRACVIIDDNTDVWTSDSRERVYRVRPFFAFVKPPHNRITENNLYRFRDNFDQMKDEDEFTYIVGTLLRRVHSTFYRRTERRSKRPSDTSAILLELLPNLMHQSPIPSPPSSSSSSSSSSDDNEERDLSDPDSEEV